MEVRHMKRKAPNESKNLAAMHLCLQGEKKKNRKKTHTTQGSSAPKPTNYATPTHLTQSYLLYLQSQKSFQAATSCKFLYTLQLS